MKHGITSDKFIKTFNSLGYTRVYKEANNLVVWTKNDVKCEIKPNRYTFGWTRKTDEIELIKEEILMAGYKISDKHKNTDCINVQFRNMRQVLKNFQSIVNQIEQLEPIKPKERGQAIKVFPTDIAETEIFLKIAKRYKHAIDNKDQYLLDTSRNLLEGDSIDHLLTVGSSKKRTDNDSYREHVVPCIMVHNKLVDMYLNGAKLTEMAQFIKTYLVIVLITKKEAEKLDIELGLKTSMPKDWNWGDSIFKRLEAADIDIL